MINNFLENFLYEHILKQAFHDFFISFLFINDSVWVTSWKIFLFDCFPYFTLRYKWWPSLKDTSPVLFATLLSDHRLSWSFPYVILTLCHSPIMMFCRSVPVSPEVNTSFLVVKLFTWAYVHINEYWTTHFSCLLLLECVMGYF